MLKALTLVSVVLAVACASEENLQQFVEGNKLFAADTYREVAKLKKTDNFLVCPFSAEVILALAQNGARGRTRTEIQTALHLSNSTEQINEVFKSLLFKLKGSETYTLHTANRIYIKENLEVKTHFEKTGKEVFDSAVEKLNFVRRRHAAKTINEWVSQQTQGKIQNLIKADSLSEDTVAVLVNALYLQATWRKNFKKTLTRKESFYNGETEVEVDTMKKSDNFGYFESDDLDAKFLQIQFTGGRNSSMVFVLPNNRDGLNDLENRIEEVYNPNFSWEFVDVALPTFSIETSIDFKKVLKKLGIKKAFTRADFSGISGERGDIHVSNVFQKTYIKVDEYGVEAAASTAVFYHPKSLVNPSGDKSFIADHPFVFYIVVDNVVIFTGRVVNPQ